MIIDPSDLTFNGDEIKKLSEAIFEQVFQKPEATLFHTFVPGIKAKKQIALLGRIEGLTGKGSGGCDPDSNDNVIGMSEKFWNPETVSNRFSECWTNLKESFFIYGTKNGLKKADLDGTDFWMFLQERVSDALIEEAYRIIWFSDVDAADVNASPPGVLTAGTDPLYFNKIDGMFKQLFAIVAADAARLTSGLTSRNGQASFAAQEFTAADTTARVVTNTLQNMRYGSDYRLRAMPNQMYVVTQSVADQYERELTEANVSFTTERLENGITVLKSGGIEVFGFQFWDRIIRTYESDGTKYNLPHRAVLLTKENMQVGTEDVANLSEMATIYDPIKKDMHLDTAYDIDAKIIEDYLVQAAY
jgi:hypothetical protein